MAQKGRHRYRIHFAKRNTIRFISHLDLHHTWERILRRASLPLVYSQGFNPRPKINLSPALPLGYTSDCEAVDIWLEEERAPDSMLHDIEQVSPQGLIVQSVQQIDTRAPSMQSQTVAIEYDVILDPPLLHDGLLRSVQTVLRSKTLTRHWRGKDYDLRPLIESLEIVHQDMGKSIIRMTLSAREGATGRPEEVISALGLDPTHARIHRTKLILGSE